MISRIGDLPFHLHIIGPFTEEDQIADSRITYYGEIKEQERVAELLIKMDVLILPSWSEGMPTVILEAMAKGCVIVANDVGAVNKLVDDSVGWLCKVGDLDALESGIRKAIDLPQSKLKSMKQNAILKVDENYLWEEVVEKLTSTLKNKLANSI